MESWSGEVHKQINKIFILQKRAIRTICKCKYRDHTEPLFKKENILKINDVFKLHVNLSMYDYRQNHLPESFNNVFPSNLQRNPENSRRPHTFYCERPQTKHVYSLQEYTPNSLILPANARGHHRKGGTPTTTTCGRYATPDYCLRSVSCTRYNSRTKNISEVYTSNRMIATDLHAPCIF